jgi:hypothetical protein
LLHVTSLQAIGIGYRKRFNPRVSLFRRLVMRRTLLLQTVQAHLALLAEKHPKKAATPVAMKARRYVAHSLRPINSPQRLAA